MSNYQQQRGGFGNKMNNFHQNQMGMNSMGGYQQMNANPFGGMNLIATISYLGPSSTFFRSHRRYPELFFARNTIHESEWRILDFCKIVKAVIMGSKVRKKPGQTRNKP